MLNPGNIEKLKELNRNVDGVTDLITRRDIQYKVEKLLGVSLGGLTNIKTENFSGDETDLLNKYCLLLANNQINESCNKLWIIMELLNVTGPKTWGIIPPKLSDLDDLIAAISIEPSYRMRYNKNDYALNSYPYPLGSRFSPTYISGTTIPSLYYSQISLLLSILSSFGCVLIRDRRSEDIIRKDKNPISDHKKREYILIRTVYGWKMLRRGNFLAQILKSHGGKGWHEKIIRLFKGFKSRNIGFPEINLDTIQRLKDLRIRTHYEVLSDLTIGNIMHNRTTLGLLPECAENIKIGIEHLEYIWKTVGLYKERFLDLYSNLELLMKQWGYKN